MKIAQKPVCLTVAFFTASIALAGGTPTDSPKYESLLMRVLSANREGVCPAELMSAKLQASCISQLSDVQLKLRSLGDFRSVTYLGAKSVNGESGEAYKVSFEHGDWFWTLAASDGRESTAYAPAPIWNVASYSIKSAD